MGFNADSFKLRGEEAAPFPVNSVVTADHPPPKSAFQSMTKVTIAFGATRIGAWAGDQIITKRRLIESRKEVGERAIPIAHRQTAHRQTAHMHESAAPEAQTIPSQPDERSG